MTELRGFLGLTGYYRKFVPNYGLITKPLTQFLTKKGFEWMPVATEAFLKLKTAMSSTPVLALADFTLPFTVETNACEIGVGDVLMQKGHPIAYMSKALGIMNQKLSIYEKEFLAVIMAVDKWRQYLQRGPFTILTDHKSLTNLNDQQLASDLQRKAMAKLVGLQFDIKYKKGVENSAADSLSRVGHLLDIQAISVENCVKQCLICQQAKHTHQKPAGLLQPLPPPAAPWQEITMDFIEGLPLSDGADSILVVVDRLTKNAHFLPLKHPYTAVSVGKLYVDNIVKLHGVPLTIISDRD
jgi:hypothetical protein